MEMLSEELTDQIDKAMQAVFDLACESGVRALIESATKTKVAEAVRDFRESTSPYHKSMWAWNLIWPSAAMVKTGSGSAAFIPRGPRGSWVEFNTQMGTV